MFVAPERQSDGTALARPSRDVEEMWYPAEVRAVSGREVLISFNGWEDKWDEWLPKASSRLREHRGWGTPAMPKDWQVGSTIEALYLA